MSRLASDPGRFQRKTPVTPISNGRPGAAAGTDTVDSLADAGLDAFAAEAPPRSPAAASSAYRFSVMKLSVAAGTLALIAGAIAAYAYYRPTGIEPAATAAPIEVTVGTVTINSQPAGAEVMVNGVSRGVTPVKLSLPAGNHQVELKSANGSRALPLVVEAGTSSTHYIDFPIVATTSTGRLEITSEPAGAEVRLDGVLSGKTPLTLQAVPAGDHRVTITSGETVITRAVKVTAGATASVVATAAPAGVSAGWVTISSPFEVDIFEDGSLIATSEADRFMLPAGRHTLEVVNTALEYRQTVTVQVGAGKTATSNVPVPNGSLSINALPWGEVSIDGRSAGTTPLGNLSVPVGTHEIVWRHPQFGERRRTVSVTAKTPVRIGVDFRQ